MTIFWAVVCVVYYVELIIALIADDVSVKKMVFYATHFLFFALMTIKEEMWRKMYK